MAGRERSGERERVWALLPVIVPFLVTLTATMGAVDLAYQVRVGDAIIAARALPHVDTFTFTSLGATWVDQQWGAQVLLAMGYRAGSWVGLLVLRATLIGATYGLVYLACRARGAGRRTSTLLTSGGILLGVRGLALRPQLLAFPLVAASLWVLAGRRAHPRRLWALPVLAAAMANLHGVFVLVPVLAALAVTEDLVDRMPAGRTLVVGAAATAATLVGPYGLGAWRYALAIATDPVIRGTISEWRPVSVATVSGAVFACSIVLVVASLIRRGRPVDVAVLAWLLVFGTLAVPASRGIVLWGIVAPTALARIVPTRVIDPPAGAMRPVVVGVLLAVIAAATLPAWRGSSPDALLTRAPVALTRALEREVPAGTNLFVWQAWASWFEYEVPEDRVFVDSRIELFSPEVWDQYEDIRLARGPWTSLLDRYDIGAVVIDAENGGLLPRLRGQVAWVLAYEDDDGALFVRAEPA